MDRLNPTSAEFHKTAATTAQSKVSQLRSQKELKQEAQQAPEDAVELTGLQAEQAARALKETGLDKKKKARTAAEASDGEAQEQPDEAEVRLDLGDPTEDVPEANLQAASRIVSDQVRKKPPADLKSIPGTADMKMKPIPMAPIEEIVEDRQGPLGPSDTEGG